jgi:hypothetical protein
MNSSIRVASTEPITVLTISGDLPDASGHFGPKRQNSTLVCGGNRATYRAVGSTVHSVESSARLGGSICQLPPLRSSVRVRTGRLSGPSPFEAGYCTFATPGSAVFTSMSGDLIL